MRRNNPQVVEPVGFGLSVGGTIGLRIHLSTHHLAAKLGGSESGIRLVVRLLSSVPRRIQKKKEIERRRLRTENASQIENQLI